MSTFVDGVAIITSSMQTGRRVPCLFRTALIGLGCTCFTATAQPANCNAAASSPSVTLDLPARPFGTVPAPDGCWVFVSLMQGTPKAGIGVVKRSSGHVELSRVVPLKSEAALGLVLTHDGKLLIVAGGDHVVFIDARGLISGAANPVLGSFRDGPSAGSVYANVTPDDKLLFVSEEAQHSITVINLQRARANGYNPDAIIGSIPTGNAPIALTFSPDGKWLYTTSQGALHDWNWSLACKPEGRDPATSKITRPEGAIVVVDVARAKTDPAGAVAARVPAGCSPVRMAISPAGDRVYVTARNSNAVLAFDTAKLLSDAEHARVGTATVGSAPVPIAVIDGGKKVIAGNSNRFGKSAEPQSLTILNTAEMQAAGTIQAGVFPREMAVSSDGGTLFLTNFGSKSLQVIDLTKLK